jgi:HD-GYP domain-containing protein (c-di-GMP phosphodiesterase class II)
MFTRPKPLDILDRSRLSLKLKPIFIVQLTMLDSLVKPAYAYKDGIFSRVLNENEGISIDFISNYAQTISSEIFLHKEDFNSIHEKLNQEIIKVTRSLSIGDPKVKATKHVNLLSMQMANLYKDPFNDELLSNQFQSATNFARLLFQNKKIHKHVFHKLVKQNHHYTIAHPLLASTLLASFLQHSGMFSEKEIHTYFLTSYFKDIGMSFIPREKFELAHLNEFDKKLFSEHADISMKILEGRLPFNKTQLNIIKNHHFLNYKIQSLISGTQIPSEDKMLTGIESTLLSSIDIIVAMSCERPYRDPVSVFKALELLKKVIADEYPQEFKNLVVFLKHFFTK